MTEGSLLSADLKLAGRLDARFFALLHAIEATGSINKAARTAGYSYRGAWLVLEGAGNLAHDALVLRSTGGAGGGGSRLTPTAYALINAWQQLQAAHHQFVRTQEAWLAQQPVLAGALLTLKRMAMKTTARNQFAGIISRIQAGPVTTQVSLALRGGQELGAALTTSAAKQMKLKKGQEAIALIKASAIVLVTDFAGYELSARNQLAGTISRLEKGAVSSMVGVTLPGGTVVTASVTNDAVNALGLAVGQQATAVFKAYSVMLAAAKPVAKA